MTEKQFWAIVKKLQKKNRLKLLATGIISPKNSEEFSKAKRLSGRSNQLNTALYTLTAKNLRNAAHLLFKKKTGLKCKEVIIMTLAHTTAKYAISILKKYCATPDKELRYFAKFALDEGQWQNKE